eukprot:7378780-Prymnesium_polylepis.1
MQGRGLRGGDWWSGDGSGRRGSFRRHTGRERDSRTARPRGDEKIGRMRVRNACCDGCAANCFVCPHVFIDSVSAFVL